MDSANKWEKWWNLSKLYWNLEKRMGDISLTAIG
jgi:hypothetical protein